MNEVYPDQDLKPNKPFIVSLESNYFRLNKFASVEFNPLVDLNNGGIDLFDKSCDKPYDKQCCRSYIIKLKVKTTPKYDTYILKDNNLSIYCYTRKDGVIEKVVSS